MQRTDGRRPKVHCALVDRRFARVMAIASFKMFLGRRVRLFTLVLAACSAPSRGVADDATVAKVVADWNDRQAKVRSFEYEWTGVEFIAKGARRDFETGGAFPETDTSFGISMHFVCDANGRARHDYEGRDWSSKKGAFVPAVNTDLFDGVMRKTRFLQGPMRIPSLHVAEQTVADVVCDVRLLPLRLLYRPFDKVMGKFNAEDLTLVHLGGVIRGHECAILAMKREIEGGPPLRNVVWVDLERDCLPLRYISEMQGNPVQQADIRYQLTEEFGWVPEEWTLVRKFSPDGRPLWSDQASVTTFLLNADVPDSTFLVHAPPGTWVRDYTKQANDKEARYIVQADGEKRSVGRGEYTGDNDQQLLDGSQGFVRLLIMFVTSGAIALAAAYLFIVRRRNRSPR